MRSRRCYRWYAQFASIWDFSTSWRIRRSVSLARTPLLSRLVRHWRSGCRRHKANLNGGAILLVVAVPVPQCDRGSTFAARRKVTCVTNPEHAAGSRFGANSSAKPTHERLRELRDDSNHSEERQSVVGALDALRFFAAPFQGPEAPAK